MTKSSPERLKYISEYFQANKQKIYERTDAYYLRKPEQYLFQTARKRAKKYGTPFNIKCSDIYIPDVCPILSTPFEKNTRYAMSLDRKDNSKGYEPDNIQVVSRKANTMKSDATPAELRAFAKWVVFNV